MIKKIYGINEKGEQVELAFKKFLMMTENGSNLEINADIHKHPEGADLALNICTGELKKVQEDGDTCMLEPVEGHRYFSILPGAANLIYLKVVRKIKES